MDIFRHYILENPWPAGSLLLILALGLAWLQLRDGRRDWMRVAAVLGFLGVCVFAMAAAVTTPAERGIALVRRLVDAAVAADTVGARATFSNAAILNFQRPENPGMDIEAIEVAIDGLRDRHRIRSNSIRRLTASTVTSTAAVVQLACRTELESGYGEVPSEWILRVELDRSGDWRITRLTCVQIAGRATGWSDIR